MAVENLIAEPVDPGAALADFAVRHGRQIRAQRAAERPHHVFDGIERNAAHQEKTVTHRFRPFVMRAGNLGGVRGGGEN